MAFSMSIKWDAANDAITTRWLRFGSTFRRQDFIRPLKVISVDMYVELDRRFSTQTAPTGRKWAQIGADTILGAGKTIYAIFKKASGKARILVFFGSFRKSFISKSGPSSIFKLSKTKIIIGSNDKRANTLHHGSTKRNIPARNIVGITKRFENTIVVPTFKEFIQKGWNG